MEWHFLILNILPWILSLVILFTVLYAISLLKRITVAIEKIAERRS